MHRLVWHLPALTALYIWGLGFALHRLSLFSQPLLFGSAGAILALTVYILLRRSTKEHPGVWIWWFNAGVFMVIVSYYGQGASQHLH